MKTQQKKLVFIKKGSYRIKAMLFLGILSLFLSIKGHGQNNINITSWIAGNSAVPSGFTNLGAASQNNRIQTTGPFGVPVAVWEATSDGSSNFNAGFQHIGVTVNTDTTYRISYWLKASGSNSCNSRNRAGFTSIPQIIKLDGGSTSSPETLKATLPNGDWFLVVGYIHPSNYSGGNTGGVYNISNANPTIPVTSLTTVDYRFPANTSTATIKLRSFMYNCNAGNTQLIYEPRFEAVNENMPTIAALLTGQSDGGDSTPPSVPSLNTISTFTHNTATLNWSASTDSETNIDHYVVSRDNGAEEINVGNTLDYTATGLTPETQYSFRVRAVNGIGLESVNSNVELVTTTSDQGTPGGEPTSSLWAISGNNAYYNAGNIGIGTATPAGKLHVSAGTSGVSPHSFSDITMENDDHAMISILTPNSKNGYFAFGDQNDNYVGGIRYNHSINDMTFVVNNSSSHMVIKNNGNVGIGTTAPDAKLAVSGRIHAEEVKVDLSVPGPDYVFKTDYELKSLEEVQRYIKENGHLPNIPSAKEMETNGVDLGTMEMKLLEKIEELTLYILEQEKRIEALEKSKK